MNRADALKLLKLDSSVVTITPEIVQQAFRRAMMDQHPDTAVLNDKPVDVGVYQAARKMLMGDLDGTSLACKLCAGRGIVPAGFGWRRCVACKGTGEKR